MVSGCTATGSAGCTFVARLWTDLTARHSPAVPTLDWIEAHLTQLEVALIPHSVHPLLSGVPETCRPRLLRDLHLSLARWLAERLRRRKVIVAVGLPSPPSPPPLTLPVDSSASGPSADLQQLSVAELRGADAPADAPTSPAPWSRAASAALIPARRAAALRLSAWIRSHRFLRAFPLHQGETSVAMLLLWGADHLVNYPSQASAVAGRS